MVVFGQINVAMFDWPWSGIHLASGLVIGTILATIAWSRPSRRFWITGVGLLVLWELVEITLRFLDAHAHAAIAPFKRSVAGFAFAPETALNILGDLVIGSVGLWIGRLTRHLKIGG